MSRSAGITREWLVVDSAKTHNAEMVGNENVQSVFI